MSKKILYTYNADTDSYERLYPTFKDLLMKALKLILIIVGVGVTVFFLSFRVFNSLNEETLRRENSQLRSKLRMLETRIDNASDVMKSLHNRDVNLYRVLLQIEPPRTVTDLETGPSSRQFTGSQDLSDQDLIDDISLKLEGLERSIYSQSQSYNRLQDTIQSNMHRMNHIPSIFPVDMDECIIASGFGQRRHPYTGEIVYHEGIDFTSPSPMEVRATGAGVIEQIEPEKDSRGETHRIIVNHGYGYTTVYGRVNDIAVKKGQHVAGGELIGRTGAETFSSGQHLHYEVRYLGTPTNPIDYFFRELNPEEYRHYNSIAENAGYLMD